MKKAGFTIVELLIVIVVIGILAAITLIAYNGIQNRAKLATVQSDLVSASKTLEQWKFNNIQTNNGEQYPADLSSAQLAGIKSSAGSTYTAYIANNTLSPAYFCLTATNSAGSYSVTSNSSGPIEGTCVTNLMVNPSFESNQTAWGGNATFTSITTGPGGNQGSKRLIVSRIAAGDAYASYVSPTPAIVPLSTQYALSYWTWGDTSYTINDAFYVRHPSSSSYHSLAVTTTTAITTTPRQVTMVGTTNATSSTGQMQFILRTSASNSVPTYYDGFMFTQTAGAYAYGDGNSPGWVWTGTPNNSASIGPAVALP